MEKLDYKKMYKDLYLPKNTPVQIQVPAMTFIMVDGYGDPNDEGGQFHKAVELLYTLSYTIKMSPKNGNVPNGYFEYVVPPLEGLWWFEDGSHIHFTDKSKYTWTCMIRQPEFITHQVFDWASKEVQNKKHLDVAKAYLKQFEEGLCVQCMHLGPYDNEPETVAKIDQFMTAHRLINRIGEPLEDGMVLRHHEIYLSDPRKGNPANMKTVLRHPCKIL